MKDALAELENDFKKAVKHIDFKQYDPYSREVMKALFIGQLYLAMKAIYNDDIHEELDGARKYWESYLKTNDSAYKDMAQDELRHAGILIKKHLINADEDYKSMLNAYETERQDLIKMMKEE